MCHSPPSPDGQGVVMVPFHSHGDGLSPADCKAFLLTSHHFCQYCPSGSPGGKWSKPSYLAHHSPPPSLPQSCHQSTNIQEKPMCTKAIHQGHASSPGPSPISQTRMFKGHRGASHPSCPHMGLLPTWASCPHRPPNPTRASCPLPHRAPPPSGLLFILLGTQAKGHGGVLKTLLSHAPSTSLN